MSIALVSNACPRFFRALCDDASRSGREDYFSAGRQLAPHLSGFIPDDADAEDWQAEINRLAVIVASRDYTGVMIWFEEHLPRCMQLIPAARHDDFRRGFYTALSEDEVSFLGD